MSWKHKLTRTAGLFRLNRLDDKEFAEEIAAHVELETEQNIERGVDPVEARRLALVKFGNVVCTQEHAREMWTFPTIESLLSDLRFGVRMLWKSPLWTAVAVSTLALGIGATTAIFSVAYSILVRPLPYSAPQQLVLMHEYDKKNDTGNWRTTALDFQDWRERAKTFSGVAAYTGVGLVLTGSGEPEMVLGQRVSYNIFSVLGVKPFLGREFRYEEEEKGRERVVILSHALWRRKFDSDPYVVGRDLTINNEPFTVVGVMPQGFSFPEKQYQAWVPQPLRGATDPQWVNRSAHFLRALGRMREGVTLAEADRELKLISADLEQQYPSTNVNEGARVQSLTERVIGNTRSSIVLLFCASGCLLLISCTNVANLLIAKGTSRQKEIAIRHALGAAYGRILRQFMTENLLLSLIAAISGCTLAYGIVEMVLKFAPTDVPRLEEVHVDFPALLFAFAVALTTGLLFGLAPLRLVRNRSTIDTLKVSALPATAGRGRQRLRAMLVVAQIAICGVLLIVAGLTARSLMRLGAVNPGFNPDHALTFNLVMTEQSYKNGDALRNFGHRLLEEVSGVPGVEKVAFTSSVPLSGNSWANPVTREGASQSALIAIRAISPEYFAALQTPVRKGRSFISSEAGTGERVAIVNEAAARKLFGGADPIGKSLKLGNPGSSDAWRTVVGVVADMHEVGLDAAPDPAVFFPYDQLGDPVTAMAGRGIYVVLRSPGDPTALMRAVRSRLERIDPNMPVNDVQLISEMISASVAQPRFRSLIFGSFALLAVTLAAVGLYGVLSYAVAQRMHEFGIRIALGAPRARLIALVITDSTKIVGIGLAAALALSFLTSKAVASLLFDISPLDPLTLAAAAAALAVVAGVATIVPARRAMKSDPIAAIRYE